MLSQNSTPIRGFLIPISSRAHLSLSIRGGVHRLPQQHYLLAYSPSFQESNWGILPSWVFTPIPSYILSMVILVHFSTFPKALDFPSYFVLLKVGVEIRLAKLSFETPTILLLPKWQLTINAFHFTNNPVYPSDEVKIIYSFFPPPLDQTAG